MQQEMLECLNNNILNFWLQRMVDHEQGGFYGRIDGNDKLVADAQTGAILNARILWALLPPIEWWATNAILTLLSEPKTTFSTILSTMNMVVSIGA